MANFKAIKSKTVWISVLGLIYAAAGYFSGNLDLQASITAGQIALSALFLRLGIQ